MRACNCWKTAGSIIQFIISHIINNGKHPEKRSGCFCTEKKGMRAAGASAPCSANCERYLAESIFKTCSNVRQNSIRREMA